MPFKLQGQIFILVMLIASASHLSAKTYIELLSACPITRSFDFPVGAPNAKGYYNAQKFGKNLHLGDDWNGTGGGNSDFGDPVYATSDGIVAYSKDVKGGWGNVIRIYHNYGSKQKPIYIESLYAHLNKRFVTAGAMVKKGQKIGSIGNVNGIYWAHLHFEIRDILHLPIGQGYSKDTNGYLDPTKFIRSHRNIKKNTLK